MEALIFGVYFRIDIFLQTHRWFTETFVEIKREIRYIQIFSFENKNKKKFQRISISK